MQRNRPMGDRTKPTDASENASAGDPQKRTKIDLADDAVYVVDGKEIDGAELRRGYKGTAETTQRFQQVSEKEKDLERRRQAQEQEAQRLEQQRLKIEEQTNKLLTDALGRERGPETVAKKPSLSERLAQSLSDVDPSLDERWREKFAANAGSMLEQELQGLEQRLRTENEQQLNATVGKTQADLKRDFEGRASSAEAQRRVREQNEQTFQKALKESLQQYGPDEKTPLQLSDLEIEAVRAKASQRIGADYGDFNRQAGAWMSNEEAVASAIRDVALDKIVAAKVAKARAEVQTNRRLGYEATDGIPGRGRGPQAANTEEAFAQKVETANQLLQEGYPPNEISGMFTQDEFKKYLGLRRNKADEMRRRLEELRSINA